MIDFRYHIVSIIAVFLALAIGIVLGVSVVSKGTIPLLQTTQNALRAQLQGARNDIDGLRTDQSQRKRMESQAAPWVVRGQLAGTSVVLVSDGGPVRWRDDVRDGLVEAGAVPDGTITLTSKWKLDVEGASDELALVVRSAAGTFEPGQKPAETALTILGQRLFDGDGRDLLRRLMDAKFLTVDGADLQTSWPPSGAAVAVLASSYPKTAPQPLWLAALARGTGANAPTVVVSGTPPSTDFSAVAALRAQGDPPGSLSTFDSAETDSGREGAAMALVAAVRGHGAHFGTEPGRRFFPES